MATPKKKLAMKAMPKAMPKPMPQMKCGGKKK